MSSEQKTGNASPPSAGRLTVAVAGILAGTLVIFVVLGLMLKLSRPADPIPADPNAPPPLERLRELEAADAEALTGYAWVDKERGIVRIPIEAAMEKLIAEEQRKAATRTSP